MEEHMNIYILYHCFKMLNCVPKNRLIIPSCMEPQFWSEAKHKAIDMRISFIFLKENETY